MAGELKLKTGTRMALAYDVPAGKEPDFCMASSFNKSLDSSSFLISVPMKGGKPILFDENQKILLKYTEGSEAFILAGYPDDEVKEGIRRYWKIRRVQEQRQFFKRADERLKAALKVTYYEEVWPLNFEGGIDSEEGQTLDISAGGLAMFCNRRFEVGEVCNLTLPRIGTTAEGQEVKDIVSAICWLREAPKGSAFRNICGIQFRFGEDGIQRKQVQDYCANLKKKYKL